MQYNFPNSLIYVFLWFLLCIAWGMQCFSDESNGSSDSVKSLSKCHDPKMRLSDDLVSVKQNIIAIGTLPAHFGVYNWIITGAIVSSTAIAFSADQSVRDFFLAHQSSKADHSASIGGHYGSGLVVVGISGGMYLIGLAFSQPWLRETGREAFTAVTLASIVTGVLKVNCGRSRPFVGDGPFRFHFFGTNNDVWSFPSGHVTVAFALSSVLASRIDNPYATIGLYGLAGLTAVQRMYRDQHWLSDVFLGASIGTVVGRIVFKSSKVTIQRSNFKNWNIVPEFALSGAGISLIRKF